MNISSQWYNSWYEDYYRTKSSTSTQSVTTSENVDEQDFSLKSISSQSGVQPPPPPPQEMDFQNMSDEDLLSYLTKMQELTGTIPGMEDGTTVDSLTDEQLKTVRNTLIEMSGTMQDMKQMPPPPRDISSISDDDLISLLDTIKSYTGSIPGIKDSESLQATDLTAEQLDSARNALVERQQEQFQNSMKQRMEEMVQNGGMAYIVSNLTASYAS